MKTKNLLVAFLFTSAICYFTSYIKAQTAYITNTGDNTISVIDVATHTVTAIVTGFDYPSGITVSHDGNKVYVANNSDSTVSVINTSTNTISATIYVGHAPHGIVESYDGSKVYVTNENSNTVSVINTLTNTIVATIPVGTGPVGIAISPDGSKVYVTNNTGYSVSVINTATNTVTATISSVGSGPTGVSVSPNGSKVYVANVTGYTVSVINAATNVVSSTINVGVFPIGVAVSIDGSKVYVANESDNTVSVINTSADTVSATIAVGKTPEGISVSPDASMLFVANNGDNTVSVINTSTNKIANTIPVGASPMAFGNFISTYPSVTSCNISLTVTTTNSSCGLATGTASVVPTGGVIPYTYAWTNGDKISLADSLSAGLYMALVTDASGCTATSPAMISDVGSPTITVSSVQNVSCNGGNDGAINLSVTGGALPLTYLWDNGATTKNINTLSAGPFEIQVTDANGCNAMKSILVTEPAAVSLSVSVTNASCGSHDGSAAVTASGGTAPYSYLWNPSAATTSASTGLAAGSYVATVTDQNGCSEMMQATIINVGSAIVTLDSILPADCSTGKGSIYISVSGGTTPYTYVWSNSATTKNLVGVVPGTYGLTVYSHSNPCTGAFSGIIPDSQPYIPSICLVTVDTATGKNVCVFEKTAVANAGISQYNFYRETTQAGVYQLLGSKSAALISAWTDPSANPLQRAWRYKITSVDTCGNESPLSAFHKTIHLAANIGLNNVINLSWDEYEGFPFATYYIWRNNPATGGPLTAIDSVPSNLFSYTDLTPPGLTNLFYYIEIKNPSGCVATGAKNPDPLATNYNSSKSNIYRINPTTATSASSLPDVASSVRVFPNPSNGEFTIQSSLFKVQKLEVYNMYGEKVYQSITNNQSLIINMNVPNGIYFLHAQTENGTMTKKIVIQK